MALLMVVITGFMALDIDAGLGYDRSRQDQDIADAGALAATYYIVQNPTGTLAAAYTAAQQIATLDGCSTPCQIPYIGGQSYMELWTAVSTAGYNTTYTSATSPTPNYPSFYVNSSGTCATGTTPNGPFMTTGVTCPSLSQVTDVGLPVKDTGNVYFGGPAGAKSYAIAASAVAQVSGNGSGSGGGIGFPCEVCIMGDLTSNDGGTLQANGGSVEIGGYIGGGGDTALQSSSVIETTNGNPIDIDGAGASGNGGYAFWTSDTATIQACQTISGSTCTVGGTVFINGAVNIAGGSGSVIQGTTVDILGNVSVDGTTISGTTVNIQGNVTLNNSKISATTVNISGTVSDGESSNMQNKRGSPDNYCNANYNSDFITPCPFTTTPNLTSATLTDPLNGLKYSLPSSCTGSYCSSVDSISSSGTTVLNAGVYDGITISNGGTVNFDPGVYIFDGAGLQITGGAPTLECLTCSGSNGVTFYFTCNSSWTPTACTASSGASGAGFYTKTNMTVNLSAPTTGPEGNLLFWFDPLDSCTSSDTGRKNSCMDLNGGGWTFNATGALYMVDSTLYKSNTIAITGPLIVGNVANAGSTMALGTLTGPTLVGSSPAPGGLVP
jgi:hypothetical protein